MVKYSGSGLRQPAMAKRKLQRIATTFAFHLKPPKRQAPDNCIGQKKKDLYMYIKKCTEKIYAQLPDSRFGA